MLIKIQKKMRTSTWIYLGSVAAFLCWLDTNNVWRMPLTVILAVVVLPEVYVRLNDCHHGDSLPDQCYKVVSMDKTDLAVFMLVTPNMDRLLIAYIRRNEDVCTKQHIDMIVQRQLPRPLAGRSFCWNRLPVIIELLRDTYDSVLYVDGDAYFGRSMHDLRAYLTRMRQAYPKAEILVSGDGGGPEGDRRPCLGLFLCLSSATDILTDWIRQSEPGGACEHFATAWPAEQGCFEEYCMPKYGERVQVVPSDGPFSWGKPLDKYIKHNRTGGDITPQERIKKPFVMKLYSTWMAPRIERAPPNLVRKLACLKYDGYSHQS